MKNSTIALSLTALILFIGAIFYAAPYLYAEVTARYSASNARELVNYTFFSATTTSATSTATTDGTGAFKVVGAKKLHFYFSRAWGAGNSGSSKFEVEVSPDGTNWYDFGRLLLIDASQTASSTVWISAATSTVQASLDLEDTTFHSVRCQVVEVTDGSHTCAASIEF
jgi:hypothetical protein